MQTRARSLFHYETMCKKILTQTEHIFEPGSLARTCNVASDRLLYQDVHGFSATESCPQQNLVQRLGFGAALIKPKDTGTPRELGLVNRPRLVCLGDQTGPT